MCGSTLVVFVRQYRRLNPVVKSYASVLLPDLLLCLNFLPRDLYHLATGQALTT